MKRIYKQIEDCKNFGEFLLFEVEESIALFEEQYNNNLENLSDKKEYTTFLNTVKKEGLVVGAEVGLRVKVHGLETILFHERINFSTVKEGKDEKSWKLYLARSFFVALIKSGITLITAHYDRRNQENPDREES